MPDTTEAPNKVATYGGSKLSVAWQAIKYDAKQRLKDYDRKANALRVPDDYAARVEKVMKGFRSGLRPTLQKYEAAKTKKEQHDHGKAAALIMLVYKKKLNGIAPDKRDNNAKSKNPQVVHSLVVQDLIKMGKLLESSLSKPRSSPQNYDNSSHTFYKVWTQIMKVAVTACRDEAKHSPDHAKLAKTLLASLGGDLAKLLKAVEKEKSAPKRAQIIVKTIPLIKKHRKQVDAVRSHRLFSDYDLKGNALFQLSGVLGKMDKAMQVAAKSG